MGRLTAIVLGAAAGGGFPQWNCRCAVCRLAWDGDPRVVARTQASLAVSADGERWTLLNASPDLRAQTRRDSGAASARQACAPARSRPCVLTGARGRPDRRPVEPARAPALHAASRRPRRSRRSPPTRCSTRWRQTSVTRRAVALEQPFVLPGGLTAELFTVPGKVPLYLERGTSGDSPPRAAPMSASRSARTARGSASCPAPRQ